MLSRRLTTLAILILCLGSAQAQTVKYIGSCKFLGQQPKLSAIIGQMTYFHNGTVKRTRYEGQKDIYTGSGDVWVIYKSRTMADKTVFRVQGQVQVCHDYK
jgi:hypothetical protein